ncbi:MAG: permease prefix domain 1-containing protein, partial [Vicinamibacterales bacterium]
MRILRQLMSWIHWPRVDADMREEIECHRLEVQRRLEADGMRPPDALRESRRQMGNVTL